jgi:hypothetical protein
VDRYQRNRHVRRVQDIDDHLPESLAAVASDEVEMHTGSRRPNALAWLRPRSMDNPDRPRDPPGTLCRQAERVPAPLDG